MEKDSNVMNGRMHRNASSPNHLVESTDGPESALKNVFTKFRRSCGSGEVVEYSSTKRFESS